MRHIDEIKDEVGSLVKGFLEKEMGILIENTQEALDSFSSDLPLWIEAFQKGEISQDDLDYLLKQKERTININGQKLEAISKIELEKLQNSILDTVVGSII